MSLLVPKQFVTQPRTLGEVNQSSPYAKGLVSLGTTVNGVLRDFVNNVNFTRGTYGFAEVPRVSTDSRFTGVYASATSTSGAYWDLPLPSTLKFNDKNEITIFAVAYSTVTTASPRRRVIRVGTATAFLANIDFSDTLSNSFSAQVANTSSTPKVLVSSITPSANIPYAVCVVRKAADVTFYVDGQVPTQSVSPAGSTSNNSIDIDRISIDGNVTGSSLTGGVLVYGIWNRGLSAQEVYALSQNPWQLFQPTLGAPVAFGTSTPVATNLNAEPGSFTLTGSAATLLRSLVLNAEPGAFTLTGSAAELVTAETLNAEPGAFTLTGSPAELLRSLALNSESGSFTLTGSPAELLYSRVLNAEPGSFTLTGAATGLLRDTVLSADFGTYVVNGFAATLSATGSINAEPGSFTVTGSPATFVYARIFNAEPGAFTLTGSAATLAASKLLSADPGAFTLTGSSATFLYDRATNAEPGAFTLTGSAATFVRNLLIAANPGSFTLTGSPATFVRSLVLSADPGSYVLTGAPATLTTAVDYPPPSDVRAGGVYGPGGIYTGTLVVGGNPIYLFDD